MGKEHVNSFAEKASSGFFACCVASLGLYWAWTFFSFNPPVSHAYPIALLHVTSMAGASLVFLLIALGWRRVGSLCARKRLLIACGLIAGLTSPLYLLGCFPWWAALAGAALSGAAISVLVCANAEAFSRFTPTGLLAGTALVFMIAYVALIALAGLAGLGWRGATEVLGCALPVVSAAFLVAGCSRVSGPVFEVPRLQDNSAVASCNFPHELGKLPWRTFCVIACMYIAIGSIRMYVEHVTGGLDMNLVCTAASVVLLACALIASLFAERRGVAALGVFYKAVMPLVALAYVVLLTAGESQPLVLSVIAQLACLVVECLCWVLIVDSSRKGAPALLVIGIGRFTVQLGMSAGELATGACIGQIVPLGTLIVFLLVASFVFLFSDRETAVRTGGAGISESTGGVDGVNAPAPGAASPEAAGLATDDGEGCMNPSRPELLVQSWGLTQREQTILKLWVTSHGLRSICETLGLSESTVKTHVRHIYEKSGVHSRAELIKLLDDHNVPSEPEPGPRAEA